MLTKQWEEQEEDYEQDFLLVSWARRYGTPLTLSVQDIHLCGGTLLQCLIVEPNFSSHTA